MSKLHVVLLKGLEFLMDSGLLFPFHHTFIFIFDNSSSHVVVKLLLFEMKIFFCLGELPPERINHNLFFLHHCKQRSFFTECPLNFLSLSLALELYLTQIIFEAFLLEFELVILSLKDSPMVSLFLNILCISNEKLILIDLELVSFLSEVKALLLGFTESSFELIDIPPELSLLFSILARVFDSELQSMIVGNQLMELLLVSSFEVGHQLLILNFLVLN
jgi:hypothetical protein